MASPWWRLLVPLLIVVLGRRARFLSLSGSIAAMCVGSAVVLHGWDVTSMLIVFFLLGSVATKIRQKEKEAAMPYPETEAEAAARAQRAAAAANGAAVNSNGATTSSPSAQPLTAHAKREGRDMWQVMATGAVPALICLLQPLFPGVESTSPLADSTSSSGGWFSFLTVAPTRPLWFLTYLAYVATCCGDTLASEIGMLSSQPPLMLWRRARVARGVDGGMTLLGTAASVAGGALVGACAGNGFDLFAGAVYGCIGSLFDSLLGTFMQSMQYGKATKKIAAAIATGQEKKLNNSVDATDGFIDATHIDQPLPLTPSAWKQLNNIVNVLSSVMAAALAVAVQQLQIHFNVQLLPLLALICALLLLTVVPDMRARYAVAGCAIITALWSLVFGGALPHEQLFGALPIAAAYCLWRVRS